MKSNLNNWNLLFKWDGFEKQKWRTQIQLTFYVDQTTQMINLIENLLQCLMFAACSFWNLNSQVKLIVWNNEHIVRRMVLIKFENYVIVHHLNIFQLKNCPYKIEKDNKQMPVWYNYSQEQIRNLKFSMCGKCLYMV